VRIAVNVRGTGAVAFVFGVEAEGVGSVASSLAVNSAATHTAVTKRTIIGRSPFS
jgi:uncharacterized membrane protein